MSSKYIRHSPNNIAAINPAYELTRTRYLICIILSKLLLDYIYVNNISPVFSYAHLTLSFNSSNIILSWLLCLVGGIMTFPLLKNINKCSSLAGIILYYVRFLPLTTLIGYKGFELSFISAEIVFWFLFFICLSAIHSIHLRHRKGNYNDMIFFITMFFVLIVFIVSGVYAHFRITLNLLDVYGLREESRTFRMPLLLSYIWPAAANLLPILMVYYMRKKNWKLFSIIAFTIIVNFSINGSKSTLFKMILCIALLFIVPKKIMKYFLLAIPIICTTAIIYNYLFHSDIISNMIIRRVFLIPNLLDNMFYEFFNTHNPVYFNTQELSQVNFEIGYKNFGRADMRCNNGLFTDAYSNLGLLGCIIYPILFAYLFKFCDAVTENLDFVLVFYSTMLICFTLGSTILTTALLTHGIAFMILTLYLISCSKRIGKTYK